MRLHAQQIIAEVGVQACTFPSAAELTSWVGTCPGKDEGAEQNHSSRSAKGNKYLRRVLNQAANAAVKNKGSYFQAVFRRLLPRLGYQSAIWAIAHRLCRVVWKILHEGVRFIEQGCEPDPRTKKRRAQMLARALRKLGYDTHKPGYRRTRVAGVEKDFRGSEIAWLQHFTCAPRNPKWGLPLYYAISVYKRGVVSVRVENKGAGKHLPR
jgi:hypothetical protein